MHGGGIGGRMLLVVALVAFALFQHPYLTYPLSLRLLRTRPLRNPPDAAPPTASLLFCACDEAASMPAKLANLRALKAALPGLVVRAHVDASRDETAALLTAHPDLLHVVVAERRVGKAAGMRRLAAACDTDVLLFTDANVVIEPGDLVPLLHRFGDPAVGGVCGRLGYVNGGASATAAANAGYWRLEERIKADESRSGSTMGADGALWAIRRSLYPNVPDHLLDDLCGSMAVLFAGLRLVSAPDVRAWEATATASGDEFRRKRRIAARAYASHRHLLPGLRRLSALDRYKYASHRWLRWHGASLLLVGATCLLLDAGLHFGPRGLAVLAFAAAVLLAVPRARAVALAIVATGLGVSDALRGRRVQVWTPVRPAQSSSSS